VDTATTARPSRARSSAGGRAIGAGASPERGRSDRVTGGGSADMIGCEPAMLHGARLAFASTMRKGGRVDADVSTTVEGDGAPAQYNPLAPGFAADPYPTYAALRAAGRVHQNPLGVRVLSHYDDCFALLRLPGTSVDDRNAVN